MPPVFKRTSDGQVRYRPAGVDTPFTSEVTKTTTGNIDNLDFGNSEVIRMNNASDSTIRGLGAGVAGQQVTIISVGAGFVFLSHQNTNSTAANRLINTVTSIDTPLSPGTGTAVLQYDATTARWRLIAHNQGAAITPVFNAADYYAIAGMTWTVQAGDVIGFSYVVVGQKVNFNIALNTTTVGGTPQLGLYRALPTVNGVAMTAGPQAVAFCRAIPAGVPENGQLIVFAGAIEMQFTRAALATWPNDTNNTFVQGQITVELV